VLKLAAGHVRNLTSYSSAKMLRMTTAKPPLPTLKAFILLVCFIEDAHLKAIP
jgi:hypothetical protein